MTVRAPLWLLLGLAACTGNADKPATDTDSASDTDVVDTDVAADTDVPADTDVGVCDVVPTCTGFGAVPAAPSYLDTPASVTPTDQGAACGTPKLLMALRDISVRAAQDDIAGDVIYCVTQVETASGAEIRITSPTPALNEGDSTSLPLTDGMIWGDVALPRAATGPVLLTMDCLEADDPAARDGIVTALTNAGTAAGATQNLNLWSYAADKPITGIVSAALATTSDDVLFHTQVTLPDADLLALAAGATWTERQSGVASQSDWDWEIGLLVWGCSDAAE